MKRNHISDSHFAACGATRQVAFAKVILPDGEQRIREVVEFDSDGNVLAHYPLTEELPFTEWRNTTFIIK